MAAELIEAAVGEVATVKWTVGEARVAPNGRPIGGLRDDSYCAFEVPESETLALNAAIIALSDRLEKRSAAVKDLARQGADIEFYATADAANRGEMIEAAAIAALARLNAGLAIDWYE